MQSYTEHTKTIPFAALIYFPHSPGSQWCQHIIVNCAPLQAQQCVQLVGKLNVHTRQVRHHFQENNHNTSG